MARPSGVRLVKRRYPSARGVPALLLGAFGMAACADPPPVSETVQFTVPAGSSLAQVTDTLVAHDLVAFPRLFQLFARARGDDRGIQAGVYEVPIEAGWQDLLDQLVAGRMVTVPLTLPEGFTLRQIAARLADFTGEEPESVERVLFAEAAEARWNVPGPGLEGYLFPDTYHFAPGVDLETIIETLVERYQSVWTPTWRARADSLGLSLSEVTALASIVEAEALRDSEMPIISGVFHNRLRIGIPLQADPTVQYALGERRARLLYADIDSVADHPYNTYARTGLPPGPIGSPGEGAIEAALHPAEVPFLYFVARPDGTHIFTSTLAEHNQARVEARREWDELERRTQDAN
ncbi:MAG: endolytic transglycosylase MltG [Gemmatimonadota bacterium]